MKAVLTVAGSDSGGGAGIQADLKTFEAHGLFGLSVITSITAQNTKGVHGFWDVPVEGVRSQLEAVLDDFPIAAIKIGMVSSSSIIEVIAETLSGIDGSIPVILDPVMVATSGDHLLAPDAVNTLRTLLFPISDLVTPNHREAEVLAEMEITSNNEMDTAALRLLELGCKSVLITGGDTPELEEGGGSIAMDVLYTPQEVMEFVGEWIRTKNTHGTGCTLSSAIASNVALGFDLKESVRRAKEYVTGAIMHGPSLGSGNRPLRHSSIVIEPNRTSQV